LAHPGGNITGVANMFDDSIGKSVEFLHSILPSAKRIAVLMSTNSTHPQQYTLVETAAKTLGLAVVPVMAPTPDNLEQAFNKMGQEKCDALFVLADPTQPKIISLAANAKMPAQRKRPLIGWLSSATQAYSDFLHGQDHLRHSHRNG
jgi:putative ABC transport system substrate-binding protein